MDLANFDKSMRKSRLKEAYTKIPDTVIQQKVLEHYAMIVEENPQTDKILTQHMKNAILPAIALYVVLPENGYSKDESLNLIRTSVLNSAKPMAKVFNVLGRLPFFFRLFRLMCKKSMFPDSGWTFKWKTYSNVAIEWDCHRCIYNDIFVKYGCPELTAIFCESDDVMYGNIPGIRWGRTKTIGYGAEVCDFCFYNQRGKKV